MVTLLAFVLNPVNLSFCNPAASYDKKVPTSWTERHKETVWPSKTIISQGLPTIKPDDNWIYVRHD